MRGIVPRSSHCFWPERLVEPIKRHERTGLGGPENLRITSIVERARRDPPIERVAK